MQLARATLRVPKREEASRVINFYETNRREFLLPRPLSDFTSAVERGQYFVVEMDEDIVAASGVFEYGAHLAYVEVSETLVLPQVQGFGLQDLFFRLRFASIVLTQGPEIGITTAVDPKNGRSVQTTLKQGFDVWPAPISEAFDSCPACPNSVRDRKCCCDFYILPLSAVRVAVFKLLIDSGKREIVLTRKNGDELLIDYAECRFLAEKQLRSMLREFAAGSTW